MKYQICNNDCFHCVYDDCVRDVNLTKKERDEIDSRDFNYFECSDKMPTSIIKGKRKIHKK